MAQDIPAGQEGKGFHRRQRRPEKHAELKGDLKKLADQAIQVADFLNHDAEIWRVEKDGSSGQIRCRTCNLRAGFALHPMRGKDKINGAAVEEKCK